MTDKGRTTDTATGPGPIGRAEHRLVVAASNYAFATTRSGRERALIELKQACRIYVKAGGDSEVANEIARRHKDDADLLTKAETENVAVNVDGEDE